MSPGEIENMGMGGAPPAFPVQDFSAFLPDQGQLTNGDMYTTDAFGNKIPYYPYGDPSDPVTKGLNNSYQVMKHLMLVMTKH